MNVFVRIGFASTIKLVFFDKSQVVTFNSKFICGFNNSDYGARSQSENMVGIPHRFIIHWFVVSKNIEEVTEVIDVKNWMVDNSQVLWWIISLVEWNSSVSSMESLIQRGFVDTFFRDPNKTPDSSQRPPHNYLKCGNPVDGLYCRQCALLRKKLKEVWLTICEEHEIFQDFLNTFESFNDNTNVVNTPQEPFVFNQDPGENCSQSPPHIDHHCYYGCGDSLDGIFCQRCTCESCGNNAYIGYNCPPKVPIISNPEPCPNQNVDELPQTLPSFHPTCYSGDENSFAYDSTPNFVDDSPNVLLLAWDRVSKIKDAFGNKQYKPEDIQELIRKLFNDVQNVHEELAEYINTPSWNRSAFYNYDDDDDDDYTIAITPVLSIEEPDNSLSMGDEHLDIILVTESDEVTKSSVEDLVPIPSEFEGIPDNMCDVPFRDNSPPLDISKYQFKDFFDSNDDSTSTDDDYFSINDIDYVEASPSDSELVSLEEVKDNILREKLLNIHLHIDKIESLNDNPTPDNVLKYPSLFSIPVKDSDSLFEKSDISLSYSDNSLPEFETFSNHTKETSSGNTTTHADNSLLDYDSFLFEIKPDQGKLTSVVMEDILGEPQKNSGSTTIHADISLPDLECFYFKSEPDPRDLTSIVDSEIRENVLSATNVKLSPEDDQCPLFAYVV
uniref:Uncharacterized protein n=1 Tax=Tanacetum cinerariifolium TaxID=118510 RepID=A0A6L2L1Z6_TANCI|nr:hypothetical protein [Tanacetum cinerariifolium]